MGDAVGLFVSAERMSEQTLEYFWSQGEIKRRDAAAVRWSHAVNSRSVLTEALSGTLNRVLHHSTAAAAVHRPVRGLRSWEVITQAAATK